MKTTYIVITTGILVMTTLFTACNEKKEDAVTEMPEAAVAVIDAPDYFSLRPELEKSYGYTHAVKIGKEIKISGAVSMDDKGNLTAPGNMEQQMKNCYSDLGRILEHYGCSFDDVVVENVLTTNMQEFIRVSAYRSSIYKKQFPTGSWLGVRELALPGQLIEIEMEAHITK